MGRHIVVVDAEDMKQAGYRAEDLLNRYATNDEWEIECILDLDTGNVRALQGNKIPEFMLSLEKLNEECRKYIVSEEECKRIISEEIKKDTVDWLLVKETTLRAINADKSLDPDLFNAGACDELNSWEFELFGVTHDADGDGKNTYAVCVFVA